MRPDKVKKSWPGIRAEVTLERGGHLYAARQHILRSKPDLHGQAYDPPEIPHLPLAVPSSAARWPPSPTTSQVSSSDSAPAVVTGVGPSSASTATHLIVPAGRYGCLAGNTERPAHPSPDVVGGASSACGWVFPRGTTHLGSQPTHGAHLRASSHVRHQVDLSGWAAGAR